MISSIRRQMTTFALVASDVRCALRLAEQEKRLRRARPESS